MPDTGDNPSPIEQLCRRGDPRGTWQWREGDPDYVAEFGLQQEDVPALIEIVREWAEETERSDDETLYAPIHAWRALGQLRAVEAIEPLLGMMDRLARVHDDWYLEEFPDVFALVGPKAMPLLAAFLADTSHENFARSVAATGLKRIGQRHAEAMPQVMNILQMQLACFEESDEEFNALLIADLLDLKAVEAAEMIERAYAAGKVDEGMVDWEDVKRELGVPGVGLIPDRPPPPRPERLRPTAPFDLGSSWSHPPKDRQRQKDRKAKTKRKQQEKARKRNRKRR